MADPTGLPDAELACRACGRSTVVRILDLGVQPIPTAFPAPTDPPDPTWPLRVAVCTTCWLVQLEAAGAPPERDDPAFRALARHSSSLSAHARETATHLRDRLELTPERVIVELGSHGNLLRPAFEALGLRTTVLEPDPEAAAALGGTAAGVHAEAPSRATVAGLRARLGAADLVVDDFLLVHLADLDDAVAGLAGLLAPEGALVLTLDHALSVIVGTQFDAFRHGHHAILSLRALEPLLARHGLTIVDAAILPIYGGSLQVEARRTGTAAAAVSSPGVAAVRAAEHAAGLGSLAIYEAFGKRARDAAAALRAHLEDARAAGRTVAGYGAPSRAATLLVAAGIDATLLPFTVDRSPAKHGRCIAGARVPIRDVDAVRVDPPDEVLLLAWPMADEIVASLPEVAAGGGSWLVPLPTPRSFE